MKPNFSPILGLKTCDVTHVGTKFRPGGFLEVVTIPLNKSNIKNLIFFSSHGQAPWG